MTDPNTYRTGNIRIGRDLFEMLQADRGFKPWDVYLKELFDKAKQQAIKE